MITTAFKTNKLYVFWLIPLFALALWIQTLSMSELPALSQDSFQMPLYTIVYSFFELIDIKFLSGIFSLILLLIQAFLMMNTNQKYEIDKFQSYLSPVIFIIISSSFLPMQRLHPIFIANLFLLLALSRIFSSHKKENVLSNYFDASLLLSIGSLFYINLIFFIPLVWISLLIIRPFRWREWAITFLGLILPYLIVEAYMYFVQGDAKDLFVTILLNLLFDSFGKFYDLRYWHENLPFYLFYGFLLILIALSSFHMQKDLKFRKIKSRNGLYIYLWMFILTATIHYVIDSASMELIIIYAISVSSLISNYLYSFSKTWVGDIFVFLLLGFSIYIQIAA